MKAFHAVHLERCLSEKVAGMIVDDLVGEAWYIMQSMCDFMMMWMCCEWWEGGSMKLWQD